MPQPIQQQGKEQSIFSQSSKVVSESKIKGNQLKSSVHASQNSQPLESVVSQLNRLSQTFVDSYQDLEGQVEKLSDELLIESYEKQNAIAEKEELKNEKLNLSDRLQNLLAIMPAGVVVLDGEGKVKDCNAMAVDILGRPLMGEPWFKVIQRAFEPQADDGHQISLKDGRKIHIETKALNTEPGQLIVLTDMTKTRKLQAELSQQQKLTSMGKMVAFLAHQIRTPLSAAILYGSHLNDSNVEESTRKVFGQNLVERLNYMERQITDMLCFVRGERKEKFDTRVSDLLDDLKQIKNEMPDFLEFDFDEKALADKSIKIDRDAISGAIVNLLENGAQACMSKKNAEEKPRVFLKIKGTDKLQISVEDNGVGIPKSDISRVFEPFFTQKTNGNGLGLAIVHGVVIEHGGKISVASEAGRCTRFNIELPLSQTGIERSSQNDGLKEVVNEL